MKKLKIDEWLNFFKIHKQKKIFSLSDLSQLTEEDKSSLAVQLNRLVKAGVIKRIAYGWYENPFASPSHEEIAMILRYPSYISMEYALSKHGILSQTVYTLTLVTTKLPYVYRTEEAVYEYHQISKNLFWGYKKDGMVKIAEPEKALLDFIYIRYDKNRDLDIQGIKSLINDMDIKELDSKKLRMYSKKFPLKTRKVVHSILSIETMVE